MFRHQEVSPGNSPRCPRVMNILRWLKFWLVRATLLTAIVSVTCNAHFNEGQGGVSAFAGNLAPEHIILILWLIFSISIFYPCSIVFDLALGCILCYRIRYPHIGFIIEDVFITGNCMGQLPYYLFLSNLFLEWVLLGLLLMTRFIGLFLCVTDVVFTCCPGDQLCDGSWKFNISIFLNRVATYDWWTLKTLPEEFLALPLKKKTLRPFITPYSEPSYNYRVKPTSSVLLGKNLFKARRGETTWFVLLRGILALGLLLVIAAYSVKVIMMDPLLETIETPLQLQHLQNVPEGTDPTTWGVLIGIDQRYHQEEFELANIVSVKAEPQDGSTDLPPCTAEAVVSDIGFTKRVKGHIFVAYTCPSLYNKSKPLVYTPRISITVDYSSLMDLPIPPEGSVQVWPYFTKDVAAILQTTPSTTLISGARTMASVRRTLRSFLKNPGYSSLGIDQARHTFVVGILSILGPDTLGPQTTSSVTSASLRIFPEYQSMDWEMQSEFKLKSVVAGFSTLGGLSIFLNAMFMLLFGGSLVLVLFDIKPLSTFGLLHLFSQRSLRQKYSKEFPQLADEGGSPGNPKAGVLAFMREYVLDLQPVVTNRNVTRMHPESTLSQQSRVEEPKEPDWLDTASISSGGDTSTRWGESIHPIPTPRPSRTWSPRQGARQYILPLSSIIGSR